ncbi:MAG: hypothetical protein QOH70_4020 [Blastocatellia bacterium]|jgi:hypothetical protein|nr:hypothetical protein [Blastocatellia bacterium]
MRIASSLHRAFDQKQNAGPVVHRSKEDVHKTASREKLLELVRAQDAHLIETKTQYIVVYGTEHLKFWC